MALITYEQAALTGLNLTLAAATAEGDTIGYSSGAILHMNGSGVPTPHYNGVLVVVNGDSTDTDVTVVTPGSAADIVVTVAAGDTAVIGPLTDALVDPADGTISVTYEKVTSLTVGAFLV